jgi:hypothetical protein
MPYSFPNPPQDYSHPSYQVGNSTSYATPHAHQFLCGHDFTSPSRSGAAMNPYYYFPSSPRVAPIPLVMIP